MSTRNRDKEDEPGVRLRTGLGLDSGGDDGGGWRRVAIGLAGVLALLYPRVVLGLESFFYRDFGVLAYPVVAYHRQRFWEGDWPFWNPLSNCGVPFLAQWGTLVLYPFSLFYLLLPLPWSLNLFCLGHIVFGGVGMYILTRQWTGHAFGAAVAGTAFALNGVTLSCLMWPNYTVALGWMPWVIRLVVKTWQAKRVRALVGGALVSALQLLSGVPEIVVFTWLMIFGLWLADGIGRRGGERGWWWWLGPGAVILLTGGLAAVQLAPFFELLAHSQRALGGSGSKWSMAPWGWANLVWPLFRCFKTYQGPFVQVGQEFLGSSYLGVTLLSLALTAVVCVRRNCVWVLGAAVLVGLVMALGEHTPFYSWFREIVPLVGLARYPIKWMVLVAFAVAALAGLGIYWLERRPLWRDRSWTIFFASGVVMVMVVFGLLVMTRYKPVPSDFGHWGTQWRNGVVRVLLASLMGLAIWKRQVVMDGRLKWGLGVVILAGLVVDARSHLPLQNPTLPVSLFSPGFWEASTQVVPPRWGEGRVFISPAAEEALLSSRVSDFGADFAGKRMALWSNLNLIEGVPKVNGSATLQVAEQAQVQALFYGRTNVPSARLLDFLNVARMTAPGKVVEWTNRASAGGMISVGQQPVFVTSAAEALEQLADPAFDARATVLLPASAAAQAKAVRASEGVVSGERFSAERVEFEVRSGSPAMVVIAQSFYPAWRAFVDGRRVAVWRANHAFQALAVPAGSHHVEVVYRDEFFRVGALVSLGSVLICVGLWFRGRRLGAG